MRFDRKKNNYAANAVTSNSDISYIDAPISPYKTSSINYKNYIYTLLKQNQNKKYGVAAAADYLDAKASDAEKDRIRGESPIRQAMEENRDLTVPSDPLEAKFRYGSAARVQTTINANKDLQAVTDKFLKIREDIFNEFYPSPKQLSETYNQPIYQSVYQDYINTIENQYLAPIGKEYLESTGEAKAFNVKYNDSETLIQAALDAIALERYNESLVQDFLNDDKTKEYLKSLPEKQQKFINSAIKSNENGGLFQLFSTFTGETGEDDQNGLDELAYQWRKQYADKVLPVSSFFTNRVSDRLNEETSRWGFVKRTAHQLWNNVAATVIMGAGIVRGALYDSWHEDSALAIIDNPWTRYGENLFDTGAWDTERQQELKELGINEYELFRHTGSSNVWQSIGDISGQSGFTIGAMINMMIGGRVTKGLKFLSKTVRLTKGLNKAAQLLSKTKKGVKALNVIKKTAKITETAANAAIAASAEAALEGLEAKDEFLEGAKAYIAQSDMNAAGIEAITLMNNNDKRYTTAYDQEKAKYIEEYGEPQTQEEQTKMEKALNQRVYSIIRQEEYDKMQASPEHQKALEKAVQQANNVMVGTFITNEVILGTVRSTFQESLYQTGGLDLLKKSKFVGTKSRLGKFLGWGEKRAVLGEDGKVRINRSRFRKFRHYAWKATEIGVGEGLEEGGQYLASSFWKNGYAPNVYGYINSLYEVDGFEEMASYTNGFNASYALIGIKDALQDKQMWTETLYGALGGMFGPGRGFRAMSAKRNGKSTYFGRGINANGEIESNFQRLERTGLRWLPGGGTISNIVDAARAEKQFTSALQVFVDDDELRKNFTDASGVINFAKALEEISKNPDLFTSKNQALAKLVHAIASLRRFDQDYYDSYMETINRIADEKLSDEEIVKMYNQAMKERLIDADKSMGAFASEIQKNAETIRKVANRANELADKVYKDTAIIDKDVEEGLIYQLLQVEDWKDRLKNIQDLREKAGTVKDSKERSSIPLTDKQKQLIINYGTRQAMDKKLSWLKKKKEELKEDKSKKARRERKAIEQEIAQIEELAKVLKDNNTDWYTFNESEIMGMSTENRSRMLVRGLNKAYVHENSNTADPVLTEQGEILRNLISQINANTFSELSAEALADEYNLEEGIRLNQEIYSDIASNSEKATEYVASVKEGASRYFALRRAELINQMDDYKSVKEAIAQLYKDGTSWENIQQILNYLRENNRFVKAFEENANIKQMIRAVLGTQDTNFASLVKYAVDFLDEKGIDFTSLNLEKNKIEETLRSSEAEFKKYIEDAEKKVLDFDKTNLYSFNPKKIQDYLYSLLSEYRTIKEQLQNARKEIRSGPTNPGKNAPKRNPTSKHEDEDSGGESGEGEVENSSKVLNFIDSVESYIGNLKRLTDEQKAAIKAALQKLRSTPIENVDDLISKIKGLDLNDAVAFAYLEKAIESTRKKLGKQAPKRGSKVVKKGNTVILDEKDSYLHVQDIYELDKSDTPLGEYVRQHHIHDYLKNSFGTESRKIYFIVDPELTKQVQKGQGFDSYKDTPIIAVVESENGDIKIGDKSYQAVSVLDSYDENEHGAKLTKAIRDRMQAQSFSEVALINDAEGNPIIATSTKGDGIITGNRDRRSGTNTAENMNSVLSILMEDEANKSKRRDRIIEEFVKKLEIGEQEISRNGDQFKIQYLYYPQSNLRGSINQQRLFVATIDQTVGEDGKSFKEVLQGGNLIALLNFNHYTRAFSKEFSKFLQSPETKTAFDDAIYTTNTSQDPILIEKIFNDDGSISLICNSTTYGKFFLAENFSIPEKLTDMQNLAMQVLRNLALDDKGEFRRTSTGETFFKWNVNYHNADELITAIKEYVLVAPATTFKYRIIGVHMKISNGLDVKSTPVTDKTEKEVEAENKVHQIQGNAENLTLSEDGHFYVDKKTGAKYIRTTSFISSEEGSSKWKKDNPWTTPSTSIGNAVDEFVRRAFEEDKDTDAILGDGYNNMSEASARAFAQQIVVLRNQLAQKGLTVVSRGITVSGKMEVTMADGSKKEVNVAGTLDLLAYDANGNFYIYDMKTVRGQISEEKKYKWSKQLSVYSALLEQQYGIKVKGINIIPISVTYPAPKGTREGRVTYTETNGKLSYTNSKGEIFSMDAKPSLGNIIALNEVESTFLYDNLEDYEKELLNDAVELNGGPKVIGIPGASDEAIPGETPPASTHTVDLRAEYEGFDQAMKMNIAEEYEVTNADGWASLTDKEREQAKKCC